MAISTVVETCREHSEGKCKELRRELDKVLCADSADTVLICGSYARREAAGPSDVDYFLVSDKEGKHKDDLIEKISVIVSRLGHKAPSQGGSFANVGTPQSIVQNIGGTKDSNENLTRRMLLLLEGDWLFNKEGFCQLRREILDKYLGGDIPDHQVALFLLNDIIRYWRTICVDYEYKTTEEDKPWAIRNVKLVFSRKLIYASGLFSVALTADMSKNKKVERLEELFDQRPLDRIVHICGKAPTARMVRCYEVFLDCISDEKKRCRLERLGRDERSNDQLFREIKNEGHQFTLELLKLFETTFHSTHPIRRAIVY